MKTLVTEWLRPLRRSSCLAAMLVATLHAAAAADSPNGTLQWSNGDALPGQLLGASKSHLRWQSTMFASPFELDLNYLKAVRFPAPQGQAPGESKEPIRFLMRNGDVMYGRLVDFTAKDVVIESERHGRTTLTRSAVASFRRMHNPALLYVGPTGLAGWTTLKRERRIEEWAPNEKGHLSTEVVGAELFRDLKLPAMCEVELVLNWRRKPGFLVAFAAPNLDPPTAAVRLETWGDEVVIQTLESDGDFEPVKTLTSETKTLHLRLYWNRAAGEISVYSRNAELLARMKGAPNSSQAHTGLYLQNKGSDLTLTRVRASKIAGGRAPKAVVDGQGRVHLVSGDIAYGRIRGYDKRRGALTLAKKTGGEQSLKLDDIASVHLFDEEEPPARSPLRAVYHDGTLLRGELASIDGDTLAIKTAHAAQPIAARLTGIRQLMFTPTKQPPPAKDLIEYEGGKLHGHLAASPTPDAPLGWRPAGSRNAAPLSKQARAKVIRDVSQDAEKKAAGDGFSDVLHLRTGDVIPCRVLLVDETHLHVKMPVAEGSRIPREAVKAVEFNTEHHAAVAGFGDRGWVVKEAEKGAIDRKGDSVVFHGHGTVSHNSVLRGGEVRLDAQWNRSAQVVVTINVIDHAGGGIGLPPLLVYFAGDQMMAAGPDGGLRLLGANMQAKGAGDARATMRLSCAGKEFQAFVNDQQVFTAPLQNRVGSGLTVSVQLAGGRRNLNQNNLLTISHLRSSGSALATMRIDDDDKLAVLTVPRRLKNNPPTHVIVAQTGDLLRGRLAGMSRERVHIFSRLDELAFPRDRLGGIIWLDAVEDKESTTPVADGEVQTVLVDGTAFTFTPQTVVAGNLVGTSPIIGKCTVPIEIIRELLIGDYAKQRRPVAYADWKLTPAKEPQFASVTAAGDPTAEAEFGLDSPLVGQQAEDFKIALLDGSRFTLSEHADKIVVLDFWATWCGPCVKAMPEIIEATGAFPRDEVVFIAVNQQENSKSIAEFLEARGWQVAVALDRDGTIGRQFQVEAIPQTVVIGKGGKIERLHVGAGRNLGQELTDALTELAAEKPGAE